MPRTMKVFVCTTVGGTKYLAEWVSAVKKLSPSMIAVAKDQSRSGEIPSHLHIKVLNHDSRRKWRGYEYRKDDGGSGKSIVMGLINLINLFFKSNSTHFIHLDSDQILDDYSIQKIKSLKWDYLQFCLPAIPSDKTRLHRKDWPKFLIRFWDNGCFGLSRRLLSKCNKEIKGLITHPHCPDIQIHSILKRHFRELPEKQYLLITSPQLVHYIRGVKITLKNMAIIKRWQRIIESNMKEAHPWYYGLPYKWWWGMGPQQFFGDFPKHISKNEPEWLENR